MRHYPASVLEPSRSRSRSRSPYTYVSWSHHPSRSSSNMSSLSSSSSTSHHRTTWAMPIRGTGRACCAYPCWPDGTSLEAMPEPPTSAYITDAELLLDELTPSSDGPSRKDPAMDDDHLVDALDQREVIVSPRVRLRPGRPAAAAMPVVVLDSAFSMGTLTRPRRPSCLRRRRCASRLTTTTTTTTTTTVIDSTSRNRTTTPPSPATD